MVSLAERLGYSADRRLVIVSCPNLGMSQAENTAVYAALHDGVATNASLIVPGPWARHAAKDHRGAPVGVHLTLNSPHEWFRVGPLTLAPSLRDGNGGYPATVEDLWDHADLDEVRRECRAQIERAILAGFDITHLDSHLNAMVQRPEFFDILLDLAIEFALPLRLDNASEEHNVGFGFRTLAAAEGVVFADHYVVIRGTASDRADELATALTSLQPGVTEITLAPSTDTPEIRAINPNWSDQLVDFESLVATPEIAELLATHAIPISYAALRRTQRDELRSIRRD